MSRVDVQQLASLGLERVEGPGWRQRQRQMQDASNEPGILEAVFRGLAGLVSEPAR